MLSGIITLSLLASVASAAPAFFSEAVVLETAAAQADNLARNKQKLYKLQQSAQHCGAMRLVMAESSLARVRRSVEIARLSVQEQTRMKSLISRMKAVKTAPAGEFTLPYVVRLELLGQGNTLLDQVDYMDVAPEGLVSSMGYAAGARFMLSGADATAWHLLMRADYARSIASNPAPTRLRSKSMKLHKVPEPPPSPSPPGYDPNQYYHVNCDDKHKGHKHKNKDHFCDHPQ